MGSISFRYCQNTIHVFCIDLLFFFVAFMFIHEVKSHISYDWLVGSKGNDRRQVSTNQHGPLSGKGTSSSSGRHNGSCLVQASTCSMLHVYDGLLNVFSVIILSAAMKFDYNIFLYALIFFPRHIRTSNINDLSFCCFFEKLILDLDQQRYIITLWASDIAKCCYFA